MCVLVTACGPGAGPARATRELESPTENLTLPLAGDAKAGRQAFLDLKCATCHRVPSEPAFPPPVSESLGPALDGHLAKTLPPYLVTAIVSPSHQLSLKTSPEVRARLEGTLSPMGDFSHIITVRQLVDLHAYLTSLK
jgi:mono/diheme cytochrome c family protein